MTAFDFFFRSCTSGKCLQATDDGQCAKECCHLEGDTPIEIRISYQAPLPRTQVQAFSGLHPSLGNGHGGNYHAPHNGYDYPYDGGNVWAPHTYRYMEDVAAHARTIELKREPPSARWSQASTTQPSDDFEPDEFASSPEKDRKPGNSKAPFVRTPMMTPKGPMPKIDEKSYFPEILWKESTSHYASSPSCCPRTPGRITPLQNGVIANGTANGTSSTSTCAPGSTRNTPPTSDRRMDVPQAYDQASNVIDDRVLPA